RANRAGVPVITATEMLESMVTSNRPTRAEASDVANAIWDGTDAVMLSQETSIGAHPVEAVRAMATICQAAQKHPSYERARQVWREPGQVGSAIAHAAASTAGELDAKLIIAFTESGTTALRCSKARPEMPVVAASPHPEVLRRTALYSGVVPLLVSPGRDTDEMISNATEAAVQSGMVRAGTGWWSWPGCRWAGPGRQTCSKSKRFNGAPSRLGGLKIRPVAPASHGLLGRIQQATDNAAHRFGPHTAEVEAFIVATAQLTPWQWRQVLATKRLLATVSKEGAGAPEGSRSIQAAIRSSEGRISEPLARAGEVLFDTLARKGEDKQVAAWQAMTALVHRSQLPALKFAVNYA